MRLPATFRLTAWCLKQLRYFVPSKKVGGHIIGRLLRCPLIHRPYRPFASNQIIQLFTIDLFLCYAFISLEYFVTYTY
jgi:hypothetical protein